ncbi:hypothetical protein V1477_015048 [Vespula maculifrons]|uniref:Uncharacterized protein n=1 Tax=Vespula maculifrons TaxID=7453 RepID=A0ABD2BJ55_VESMC
MNPTKIRVRKSNWIFRRNFREVLKNAAIRSAILAHHKILKIHKYFRPRSHRVEVAAVGDPRANGVSTLNFANQTKSITVGLLIAPENTTPVPADTRASVLPILPVFRADISRFAKTRKRRREREENEKRRKPERVICERTRERDGAEKKRKQRISVRCNGTHACMKKMKMGRKDGHRKSVHPTKTRTRKSSSIFLY